MAKEEIRVCIECGEKIKGRIDKKYCSDQCRFLTNNRNKQNSDQEIITINNILRKNRRILRAINPEGKSTVSKDYLIGAGYNFRFFTSYYRTKKGNLYFLCYEYGYMSLPDGKVLIINRQDFMESYTPNEIPNIG